MSDNLEVLRQDSKDTVSINQDILSVKNADNAPVSGVVATIDSISKDSEPSNDISELNRTNDPSEASNTPEAQNQIEVSIFY
jgi:hypothetical protein